MRHLATKWGGMVMAPEGQAPAQIFPRVFSPVRSTPHPYRTCAPEPVPRGYSAGMSQTRTLRITFDLEDPEPPHPTSLVARAALERLGLQAERVALTAERDAAMASLRLCEQTLDIMTAQGTRTEQQRDGALARVRELEPYVQTLEFERQRYVETAAALGRALVRYGDHEAGCVEGDAVNGALGCTCGYMAARAVVGTV